MNNSDWNFTEFCGLYYKNYDGVITTSYTSKETYMNGTNRNLHSSVRCCNCAIIIFIIQATVQLQQMSFSFDFFIKDGSACFSPHVNVV